MNAAAQRQSRRSVGGFQGPHLIHPWAGRIDDDARGKPGPAAFSALASVDDLDPDRPASVLDEPLDPRIVGGDSAMAGGGQHIGQSTDSGAAAAVTEVATAARGVEQASQRLSASLPARAGRFSLAERGVHINSLVEELARSLQSLQDKLVDLGDDNPLAQLGERAGDLVLSLERIASVDDLEGVRAVEVNQRSFSLSLMPFDISTRFLSMLQSRRCAWIFTSATLSMGEDFRHFTGRLGLGECPTLKIESPFDYARQSLLYLPTGLPDPASSQYVAAVIETALPLIDAARGGAFVLFTSHRALSQGASILRACWSREACSSGQEGSYRLFVQGEAPRERLLKEFREDGNGVLLGTASFWEGVDVKGEALRLVIIEKLPFASPEDPLVKARIDHLQASGGNAFRDYQLPEAALALKQGVGRLIRSEDDYGTVVICDPRVIGRGYGRVLLAALPPMTPTRERDEALSFIRKHAPRDVPKLKPTAQTTIAP